MTEAHIRADDGVKREAKHPIGKLKPSKEGREMVIPANLNADQVIMEYLTTNKTSQIAAKYGLRRAALTRWLCQVRPKEWKEAQTIRALCTREDGTEAIYDATSGLALARARALIDLTEWTLERLDSANYGQKQEVTVRQEIQLETILDGLADQLLAKIRGNAALPHESQVIDVTDNDKV